MASKWTRNQAFRLYNTKPRNPNWSWSARSADRVVVTLWKDEFTGPAGRMTYERHGFGNWHKGNGNKFFFKDLAWAVAHCGGIVRVIVAVRDRDAFPRVRVAECYPSKNVIMRVTHLDPLAGAFKLEQVVPTNDVRFALDLHVRSQAA
jgi:hypothetical protein